MAEPLYTFTGGAGGTTCEGPGETWIVHVARRGFQGSKRSWPVSFVLGTVKLDGRISDAVVDPWHPGATVTLKERDIPAYLAEAERLLQCSEMWAVLMPAREKYLREEQETGTFYVTIGGTESSRWHTYRRAADYAEERLFTIWQRGLQVPRRAEISRGIAGTAGDCFQAMEVDTYGHVKMARLKP